MRGEDAMTWTPLRGAVAAAALLLAFAPRPSGQTPTPTAARPADLVLRGGKIVTVDESRPEAQAMAVQGDTIVALGSDQEMQRFIGPATKVIDLKGALATPGFIDAHIHFTGVGEAARNLKLATARNWDDIVRMVGDAAKKARPGEWILGRGWHQEKWSEVPSPNVDGFPLHDALSRVSPNNPVWLTHASGHAGFANALAMKIAEVQKTTADPAGGQILKDNDGNPTGLFNERAQSLVSEALARDRATRTPAQVEADLRQVIALASQEALSKGLTSVHDAGSPPSTIEVMKKVVDEGKLPLRVWMMLREDADKLAADMPKYRVVNYGDKRFTVRAIKRAIDGALGSRGAWMLEPYADLATTTGMLTDSLDDIRMLAELSIKHDYQMAVHAIGDRGNRETLNIYEAGVQAASGKERQDTALADRARAAHQRARHPALRAARRDRLDGRDSLHVRRAVRAGAARPEARRGRRLRVAEADEVRRRHRQRHRRAGRGHRSDSVVLRVGLAQGEGRHGVLSGSADEPHGGAALLHHQRRVRGLRRGDQGIARRRQARRRDGVLEGHHDGAGGSDSDRRGSSTRSSAAKFNTPRRRRPHRNADSMEGKMESVIAGLLKDFEDGKMTRRQLIQSLAMAAAAAMPAAAAAAQTAPAIPAATGPAPWKTVWLDHISYAVSDYRRSTAFYRDLMGWEIKKDNGTNQCFDEDRQHRRHHHPEQPAARGERRARPRCRRRRRSAADHGRHQPHLVGHRAVGHREGQGGARTPRPEAQAGHGGRQLQELARERPRRLGPADQQREGRSGVVDSTQCEVRSLRRPLRCEAEAVQPAAGPQ